MKTNRRKITITQQDVYNLKKDFLELQQVLKEEQQFLKSLESSTISSTSQAIVQYETRRIIEQTIDRQIEIIDLLASFYNVNYTR